MKPSDFTEYPWSSVFRNSECETIARNIMIILKRTGDNWRKLEWEEYVDERGKDGASGYSVGGEKEYYDKVVEYTTSSKAAKLFSPTWDKA